MNLINAEEIRRKYYKNIQVERKQIGQYVNDAIHEAVSKKCFRVEVTVTIEHKEWLVSELRDSGFKIKNSIISITKIGSAWRRQITLGIEGWCVDSDSIS